MSRHPNFRILALAALFGTQSTLAGTLATVPLTLKQEVPSNVLFSLSVEYPTANTAAYQGSNDYSSANTYLGIFDDKGCYDYDVSNGRFDPVLKGVSTHVCTGHWSGNFLNWATMTGLDEFRSAMTGGNRIVDTSSLTVLQRAYQSGQGGTSNFTDKTYSGSGATPYPSAATLTITNQGLGSKMSISLAGTGTANCAKPTLNSGSFSCSITMADTNEVGSCSSWTGSGTNNSPYTCATFGAFPVSGTPSSATGATKSTATGTIIASETVTCTNPTYSGSSFSCTLKDSSNTTGSCTTWQGTGTSLSPFSCSGFGLFGSATFTQSSQSAATTFNSGSTSNTENASSCSYSSSKITCTLPSGGKTTCTTSGLGTTSNPYICKTSSTWTIANRPSATVTALTNGTLSSAGTKKYQPPATVTYSNPNAYYYIPGYSGSDSSTSNYYYYSTYNVGFGGSTSYNVNVKVCDSKVGLESNCTPYGTDGTIYKPTGSIQQHGNTMRFGLFSYYNAEDIDNAVMRSKAKYVAPTKWTESGSSSNTNMEWSATDGTFVLNPDPTEAAASYGGAVTNSGVINYINKFGYGAKTYKTRDNVGKLYYETLKYLRGLKAPTLAFYEKSNSTNNDGFPVITAWDDPVQYYCQKNFIINMGDTHTHCDSRLPGGLFTDGCGAYNGQAADYGSLSDDGVNAATWTTYLGVLEGLPNLASTRFQDYSSYYMSGLAYWANRNGFRTFESKTMKAQTYIIDVQEYGDLGKLDPESTNGWKNSASQYWYAAKYGGAPQFNSNGSPYDSTVDGNPVTTEPDQNSWWMSSTQTTGKWPKNLLAAGNPETMKKAVNSAFDHIEKLSATDSAAGVSNGELGASTGTDVFTTTYSSNNWYGDVLSYHINGRLGVSSTPTWSASTYLNPTMLNSSSGTPPWKSRRVITFNDGLEADGTASTSTNGRRGVEFRASVATGTNQFTTNFSPRQQALLNQDPGAKASTDGVGSDRVDYLRGDNSNEGSIGELWRVRSNSLGDIIHSSATYVRYPTYSNIPATEASTYKAFATTIASRTPVVYAGANDGMLHAFNASDNADDGTSNPGATANSGREVLAYVPAAVYSKLHQLTSTSYAHQYYVDSTPVVADAQLSSAACTPSSDTYKCWRTVIVGGLKAGGQGIYALDGTNPSGFASTNANSLVLWEFTDRDDSDLGYTFSTPQVRKMNNGAWAVIFGNGYNNTDADGVASSDGRAYLYILMLDGPGIDSSTGRGKNWTQNTNYFKIKLNAPSEGTAALLSPANGLSSVQSVDNNNDNVVDYLYAGDRYGNIWKIDVSSTNPSNWKSAFGTVSDPEPLFTAVSSDSTPATQQITTTPLVVANPNGGYMVMFGTGSFIDAGDKSDAYSMDSFYGIWDKNDGTKVTGRSKLQKQGTLAYDSTGDYNLLSNCSVQYSSTPTTPATATTLCPSSLAPSVNSDGKVAQQFGWVLDLNFSKSSTNPGERYISDNLPILSDGLLTFRTLTPKGSVCDPGYATYEYNINYLTGGSDGNAIYYNFPSDNTTPTAINTAFSINNSTISAHPSGRKISGGGAGQNPAGISARGSNPYDSSTSGTGCNPFVAGRACRNPNWNCTVTPGSPPTVSCRKGTPTGEISWRQITN